MNIKRTRKQDIIGISSSDLIILCNFRENYAKNLEQFINSTFEYNDFTIEVNGVAIIICLKSFSDIRIIFKKKTIKHKIEITIESMLIEDTIEDSYYNYKSFCEMLKRISNNIKFIK